MHVIKSKFFLKKCVKCKFSTWKTSGICKSCTESKLCGCGMKARSKRGQNCNRCHEWGKRLRACVNSINRKHKKLKSFSGDKWLKWAALKQCSLINRSRVNLIQEKR